jgi:hypothetical protein
LADDVLVGETDHEAVLGRIVLVLGLGDQPLTGIVVGCVLLGSVAVSTARSIRTLSLPAALVLDLVPREVGVVLLELGLLTESAIGASNPHSKHLAKTPLDSRRSGLPSWQWNGGVHCGRNSGRTYERHLDLLLVELAEEKVRCRRTILKWAGGARTIY